MPALMLLFFMYTSGDTENMTVRFASMAKCEASKEMVIEWATKVEAERGYTLALYGQACVEPQQAGKGV